LHHDFLPSQLLIRPRKIFCGFIVGWEAEFTRHSLSCYSLKPHKPNLKPPTLNPLILFLPPPETTAAEPPGATSATTQPIGPSTSATTQAALTRAP
jgi:hypothetical protein